MLTQELEISLYASELEDDIKNPYEYISPDKVYEVLSKINDCIQADNCDICPDSKLTMIDRYIKNLNIGINNE